MRIKPRFVIDTNVLLVSISSKSQYHWIFRGLLDQEFEIAFTTEILSEYEEIIAAKYSPSVAQNVIRTLLVLPNAVQSVVYYNWCLLAAAERLFMAEKYNWCLFIAHLVMEKMLKSIFVLRNEFR